MLETSATLLEDIRIFALRITSFVEGLDIGTYLEMPIVRGAVERNLQTLGEAAIQLRSSDSSTANQITDIEKIIGLRHRLAHGYFDDINDELIWATATQFIPMLLIEVESLLEEAGFENHDREK
jgi:uncharacterized protein with HEPN domain